MEKKQYLEQGHYYHMFNAMDKGFCIIELIFNENQKPIDYRFLDINAAFEKQSGLSDIQGRRIREFSPDHEEYWFEIYGNVALTGKSAKFQNFAKNLHRWFEVYAFSVGPIEEHNVAVMFEDITEQKLGEDKLLLRENQLETFFANSPAILNIVDSNFCYINTDKLTPTYFGLTRESIKGKSYLDLSSDLFETNDDRMRFVSMMRGVLETGEPVLNFISEAVLPERKNEFAYWRSSFFRVPLEDQKWGLGVISSEITDMKRSEKKLIETKERLKAIFDNLGEGLVTVDPEGRTLDWNPASLEMHGYDYVESKLDFLSKVREIFEPTTIDGKFLEYEQWPISRMMRGENFRDYPMYLRNKEQGWKKLILYSGKLVRDSSGKPLVGFLAMRDITRQKEAEENLRTNEENFRTLADNISQFAWTTDEAGGVIWYNKRWYDYTGTTFDEIQGWGWKKVHSPDHIDRVIENWTDCLKEGKPWEDIFPLKSKEGEYRWFLTRAVPIHDNNGKILRWFGTNTDITESRKAEEQLNEAYEAIEKRLKEKEVLLREIYHRTKNTLQLISSILSLRSSVIHNPEIKNIIEDMQDRIKAIALIHEKLYIGDNLSRVNLKDYIHSLAILLIDKYFMGHKIELKFELEEIFLLIDSVIPCGLIITELIMNSVKHGFPGEMKGNIEIKLRRLENQAIELIISDNGIGPKASYKNKENTLGLKLFRSIAENQLNATVLLKEDHGVEWTICFREGLYNERV